MAVAKAALRACAQGVVVAALQSIVALVTPLLLAALWKRKKNYVIIVFDFGAIGLDLLWISGGFEVSVAQQIQNFVKVQKCTINKRHNA